MPIPVRTGRKNVIQVTLMVKSLTLVTAPGTYYLKMAAWIVTSSTCGPDSMGFDNVQLDWQSSGALSQFSFGYDQNAQNSYVIIPENPKDTTAPFQPTGLTAEVWGPNIRLN